MVILGLDFKLKELFKTLAALQIYLTKHAHFGSQWDGTNLGSGEPTEAAGHSVSTVKK